MTGPASSLRSQDSVVCGSRDSSRGWSGPWSLMILRTSDALMGTPPTEYARVE